jgi:hypothetical protein
MFSQDTQIDDRKKGTVRNLLNAGKSIRFNGSIEMSKQMTTLSISDAGATVTTSNSL